MEPELTRRTINQIIDEACEEYGIGRDMLITSPIEHAQNARAKAVSTAVKEGHSAAVVARVFNYSSRYGAAKRAAPRPLPEGERAVSDVCYDLIQTHDVPSQGRHNFRGRMPVDVSLALFDIRISPAGIELYTGIDQDRAREIAGQHGALVDPVTGSVRFHRDSWMLEGTPVWIIGRYPGYVTFHPPLDELEIDMTRNPHIFVWSFCSRYQILRSSLTLRTVPERERLFDERTHIGWQEWQ